MRAPIRKYNKATIYFRGGGSADVYEVCLYSAFVIYYDGEGHERTMNIHLINEIVHYKEEGSEEE